MKKIFFVFLLLLFNASFAVGQEKFYFQTGAGITHSLMEIKENELNYPFNYKDDPLWEPYRKKKISTFISYLANIGCRFHQHWSVESGFQSGHAGYKNQVDAFYDSFDGGIQSLHVVSFMQSRYFRFAKIPVQIRYYLFQPDKDFNLSAFVGLSYSIPIVETHQMEAIRAYPTFINPDDYVDKNPLRANPFGFQTGIQAEYKINYNLSTFFEGQFFHGGEYSFTVPYDAYSHTPQSAQYQDMLFDRSLHFQLGLKYAF